MQIVRELGGYSLGRADLVRRAMSKKKTEVMEQERKNFVYGIKDENGNVEVEGAMSRGIDEKTAIAIFDEMMDFAKYAFNKSHAAAYAFVSYQTAWLKCHYPTEFYAATLTSILGQSTKVTKYINAAKKQGINLLPPDINKSYSSFVPDGSDIRFGLGAIKNVGTAFIDEMTEERSKGGEFTSFTDFCNRMADKKLNKRIVESMIKSGVFDSLNLTRATLLGVYEGAIDSAVREQKNMVSGQLDFFSIFEDDSQKSGDSFANVPEFEKRELLNFEKDYLGVYVSGHPLDGMEDTIAKASSTTVLEVIENENGEFASDSKVKIGGMISKRREQLTKRGELMLYITLEDLSGEIEVIVFPGQVRKFDQYLKEESICLISGNLDMQEDKPTKIRLEAVAPLYNIPKPFNKLFLKLNSGDEYSFSEVKRVLAGRKGSIPVIIYYEDTAKSVQTPQSMWVSDRSCIEELSSILGEDNVKTV